MIALAVLLAAQSVAPPVRELPEPAARETSIEASVELPKLTDDQFAALAVVVRTIPKQTEEYIRRDMASMTLGGQSPRCELTPDHIRIGIVMPPGDVRHGLGILESLVRRPSLFQDALNDSADSLATRRLGPWEMALQGRVSAFRITHDQAAAIMRYIFRPDRIYVAVGGQLEPGLAESEWERRTAGWAAPSRLEEFPRLHRPALPVQQPGPVSTLELRGKSFVSSDVAMSQRLLALMALGAGKGSSLFRISRETHAWSYRQEGVLWPVPGGWEPRLIALSANCPAPSEREGALRADMLQDVSAWTESDRARALGIADAVLNRGLEFSPMYLGQFGPMSASLDDQTFLSAYWPMKTGSTWDPERLLTEMRLCNLDDLKETATDLLQTAEPIG